MPKIDYPVVEELQSQTDAKEPLLYLGLEGQWQEAYHQSSRNQGHQLELEPVAREKNRKIAWPPFPPALWYSASDSHWPLPGSQLVREPKNAILCNKEQPRERGQGMDLRTNKKANG